MFGFHDEIIAIDGKTIGTRYILPTLSDKSEEKFTVSAIHCHEGANACQVQL